MNESNLSGTDADPPEEDAEELRLSPSETVAHNSAMRLSGSTGSRRSTRKALASIVLGFELIIVVLIGLSIFGLGLLEPRELGLYIAGALAMLCLLALGFLRRGEIGIWIGHALHLAMLATAVIIPTSLIVSIPFAVLWVYSLVRGGRIDDQRKAWEATQQDNGAEE